MKLTQYVKENPDKTLDEIQAYTTYVLNDADELREHLMLKGKWGNVMKHTTDFNDGLFDAASGLLHKINKEQPISFSPYTKNGNIHIQMLDGFVAANDITADEKAEIILLATNRPFHLITQDEFFAAKRVLNPTTIECTYPTGNFITKTRNDVVTLNISTPISYDDNLVISASSTNKQDDDFIQDGNNRGFFHIPADFTGKIRKKVNNADLDTQCKYFVSSKFNREFTCSVKSVS